VHKQIFHSRGMCHTSTAQYFYGATKKSLHKPRASFGNMLLQIISYVFNYYVQLLCLQFLSKTHYKFLKFTFGIKIVLFLKSSLYKSMIVKIVHLQNKTFIYKLDEHYLLYTLVSTTIILDFRDRRNIDP
jgi:hypothetical protein